MYYSQWADRPQEDSDNDVHIKQEVTHTPSPELIRASKWHSSNPNLPSAKWRRVQKDSDTSAAGNHANPSMSMGVQVIPLPQELESSIPSALVADSSSDSSPSMVVGSGEPSVTIPVSNIRHSIDNWTHFRSFRCFLDLWVLSAQHSQHLPLHHFNQLHPPVIYLQHAYIHPLRSLQLLPVLHSKFRLSQILPQHPRRRPPYQIRCSN